MLSPFDKAHIGEIIGERSKLEGMGDWFSAELLRLIAIADSANKEKLRKVYPEHVKAYEHWYYGVEVK
jgi:hypothetical protein